MNQQQSIEAERERLMNWIQGKMEIKFTCLSYVQTTESVADITAAA
jgi:hypothetical protein